MKSDIDIRIRVPSQTRYLGMIGKIGENMAFEIENIRGSRESFAQHLNVVLTEAVANAIKHANADDPDKEVEISIRITCSELSIKVYDRGRGFDLSSIRTASPDRDDLEEQGRGIFIIKSLMDSVVYRKINGMNVLEMRKKF